MEILDDNYLAMLRSNIEEMEEDIKEAQDRIARELEMRKHTEHMRGGELRAACLSDNFFSEILTRLGPGWRLEPVTQPDALEKDGLWRGYKAVKEG